MTRIGVIIESQRQHIAVRRFLNTTHTEANLL